MKGWPTEYLYAQAAIVGTFAISRNALPGIIDIEVVVVEGGQGANHAAQDGHRMGIATEAVEEPPDLLVQHGVAGDVLAEGRQLLRVGQFAFQQQIRHLDEIRMFGELLDRVAPVQQDAGIAIDVGDLAFAGCGGAVARVEGENAEVTIQLADIRHRRAEGTGQQRQGGAAVAPVQGDGDGGICRPGCRAAHVACILGSFGSAGHGAVMVRRKISVGGEAWQRGAAQRMNEAAARQFGQNRSRQLSGGVAPFAHRPRPLFRATASSGSKAGLVASASAQPAAMSEPFNSIPPARQVPSARPSRS
jgi:hypothetical protein